MEREWERETETKSQSDRDRERQLETARVRDSKRESVRKRDREREGEGEGEVEAIGICSRRSLEVRDPACGWYLHAHEAKRHCKCLCSLLEDYCEYRCISILSNFL